MRLNGKQLEIDASVEPAGIAPEHLVVELMLRRGPNGPLSTVPFELNGNEGGKLHYHIRYRPDRPGSYVYGVRLAARHPLAANPHEVAFVKWA